MHENFIQLCNGLMKVKKAKKMGLDVLIIYIVGLKPMRVIFK